MTATQQDLLLGALNVHVRRRVRSTAPRREGSTAQQADATHAEEIEEMNEMTLLERIYTTAARTAPRPRSLAPHAAAVGPGLPLLDPLLTPLALADQPAVPPSARGLPALVEAADAGQGWVVAEQAAAAAAATLEAGKRRPYSLYPPPSSLQPLPSTFQPR